MPRKTRSLIQGTGEKSLGLERLVFFSDAVMAIAITLLAIDLRLPEASHFLTSTELADYLGKMTPRLVSFFISFAVIGVYWISHHRYFNLIRRYDNRLLVMNLIFLIFIVLMPFIASILGQYAFLPLGVAIYAAAIACTGLAIGGIWWYASSKHRLVDENLDEVFIRRRNLVALLGPLLFLLSVPLAYLNSYLAMASWWISPLISLLVLRIVEHREIINSRR